MKYEDDRLDELSALEYSRAGSPRVSRACMGAYSALGGTVAGSLGRLLRLDLCVARLQCPSSGASLGHWQRRPALILFYCIVLTGPLARVGWLALFKCS